MPDLPAGNHYVARPSGATDLPYMSARELEDFIRLNPELRLSEEEGLYLRLRRRRLSVQRCRDQGGHGDEADDDGGSGSAANVLKVVAVGDDSVASKERSLQLFLLQDLTEDAPALALKTPCAISRRTITFSDAHTAAQHHTMEVWVPPCDEERRTLRKLCYASARAFLVFFSITDRVSFNNVRMKWLGEVQAHLQENTDIPVLLVGTDSEVSSEEAVALAQSFGAAKYIEVFSHNLFHAKEVMSQTLAALSTTRHWGRPAAQMSADDRVFREHLTSPTPVGRFDLMTRTFHVHQAAGTRYYMTLSDRDPTLGDIELTGPFKLRKPYPARLSVKAFRRCWYPSETLVIPVPEETPPPKGYFDVVRRGFFVFSPAEGAGRVHYTTDGSKPTEASTMLSLSDGLLFDSGLPGSATDSSCDRIPDAVTLIAVEEGRFRSKAVAYHAPPMLSQPRVSFSESDRVLKILSPQGGVEYRYTLDGSVPSSEGGSVITGAVMLPKDAAVTRIRVAAFPRLAFPSRVVDVPLSGNGGGGGSAGAAAAATSAAAVPAVAMTKTASARVKASHQRRHATSPDRHGSSFSRTSSPTAGTSPARHGRLRSGSGARQSSPARSSSANSRSGAPAQPPRRLSSNPNTSVHRGGSSSASAASAAPTAPVDSSVTCSTRNSSLDFNFEDPIAVTHLTVATPGGGKGPEGYQIFVQPYNSNAWVEVGTGSLKDGRAVQVMNVTPACRTMHSVKVQVHFTKPNSGLFRIDNVQIHGKPAVVCP